MPGTVVSGASTARPVTISAEPVPFGVEEYEERLEEEGGEPAAQAGGHPFQFTNTFVLNAGPQTPAAGTWDVAQPALPRNLHFKLPPGLIGNPTAFPQCTDLLFTTLEHGISRCPADTAVGVTVITFDEPAFEHMITGAVPVFNLVPEVGEPARFGFTVENNTVVLDTSVRTGGDYGVTVTVSNIPQTINFLSSRTTIWGVPGDPRHDPSRGWPC